MEILVVATLLGLIPAAIAQSKGRSFFGFWIYGTLFLIIALPHSLLMSSRPDALDARNLRSGHRKCPSCAELIRSEAKVCRYCGRDVPPGGGTAAVLPRPVHDPALVRTDENKGTSSASAWAAVAFVIFALGVAALYRQYSRIQVLDRALPTAAVQHPWGVSVTALAANFRAQPQLDAEVLATLVKGQTLTVHRWTGGWYESSVETDSGRLHGFIHESVVSE